MLLFVIFDGKKIRIGVWFSCNFSGFLAIGTYIVTYGADEKSCCQWCRFSYLWCCCLWCNLVTKSKSSCQWCTLAFGAVTLVCFLAVILSETCFYFLELTLHPSLFCHLHPCPDLSFNLSIVFGSFRLARLSFSSGLAFGHKDLRHNPVLPLSALLAKKFSCCVSYCLVEVGDHGVQISIFIYQRSKRCKSTTCSCLESTNHCWIIQHLEVKPDSWLV